jgi:hypothetical protein
MRNGTRATLERQGRTTGEADLVDHEPEEPSTRAPGGRARSKRSKARQCPRRNAQREAREQQRHLHTEPESHKAEQPGTAPLETNGQDQRPQRNERHLSNPARERAQTEATDTHTHTKEPQAKNESTAPSEGMGKTKDLKGTNGTKHPATGAHEDRDTNTHTDRHRQGYRHTGASRHDTQKSHPTTCILSCFSSVTPLPRPSSSSPFRVLLGRRHRRRADLRALRARRPRWFAGYFRDI